MNSSKKGKVLIGIVGGVCLCAVAAFLYGNAPMPSGAYELSMDEPANRLVVAPFRYSESAETPVWVTQDQGAINRWKNAIQWEDGYAICCDEITTHTIQAFQDNTPVYTCSYGGLLTGYHNGAFNLQQQLLVNAFESTFNRSYQYTVTVPLGTDFEAMSTEMEDENDWFLYKRSSLEIRPYAQMTYCFLSSAYAPNLPFDVACDYGDFAPDEAFEPFIQQLEEWQIVAQTPHGVYNSGDEEYHWREMRVLLTRSLSEWEADVLQSMVRPPENGPEGLYAFETNSFEDRYTLRVITPSKLTKAQRDQATARWDIAFALDTPE